MLTKLEAEDTNYRPADRRSFLRVKAVCYWALTKPQGYLHTPTTSSKLNYLYTYHSAYTPAGVILILRKTAKKTVNNVSSLYKPRGRSNLYGESISVSINELFDNLLSLIRIVIDM